jgi:hypothetical protein
MPPSKTKTTTASKAAKNASKGSSNRSPRGSSPTATRRSGRFSTYPLNPNRALERELAEADRSDSEPEDQSESEIGSLATRGGGNRVISTVPVQPMAELTVKEAEKLRTALQQNQEVQDVKPWGFLTSDTKTALHTRLNLTNLPLTTGSSLFSLSLCCTQPRTRRPRALPKFNWINSGETSTLHTSRAMKSRTGPSNRKS